jgi:hypothetical protein
LFRRGEPDRGREAYEIAITKASEASMLPLKVRAGIHLAREELAVDPLACRSCPKGDTRTLRSRLKMRTRAVLCNVCSGALTKQNAGTQLDSIIATVQEMARPCEATFADSVEFAMRKQKP